MNNNLYNKIRGRLLTTTEAPIETCPSVLICDAIQTNSEIHDEVKSRVFSRGKTELLDDSAKSLQTNQNRAIDFICKKCK